MAGAVLDHASVRPLARASVMNVARVSWSQISAGRCLYLWEFPAVARKRVWSFRRGI
jgi:hypothetical protein